MTEAVFPSILLRGFPLKMKTQARTLVQTSASGKEQRAKLWNYVRRTYTLAFEVFRDDVAHNEWKTMLAFWLARSGSFDTFLFQDPNDNTAVGAVLGVGDGSNKIFQLARSFGGFVEPITAPNVVSTVYVNAVSVGGAFTVDPLTGLVTLTTAAPAGQQVTADFTYYFRCRLLNDSDEFEQFNAALWMKQSLQFITLKT